MSPTSDDPTTPVAVASGSGGDHESVYDGLLGEGAQSDQHWAFGTGFADALAGIDTAVPDDVDATALAALCLTLGDDALVWSHRLSQWCSRAPDLEDDIALSNIALDLLGQARLLLGRAGAADPTLVPVVEGSPAPVEDLLAYFRDAPDVRSSRFSALTNGDFADVVVRLLLWSAQRLALLSSLRTHPDPVLAAVAAKGVKEVTYHRDWSARWWVVLAQGTGESRRRIEVALTALWPAAQELWARHPEVRHETEAVVDQVLAAAGLDAPAPDAHPAPVRDDLPDLLADLQSLARAHPTAVW